MFKWLKEEVEKELLEHIVPFWSLLKDERGGFYGKVDFALSVHKDSPKGSILHSRILWFYSNLYLTFKNTEFLTYADHAYVFLRDFAVDKEFGGIYWMLDCNGKPLEDIKHTYNQSFCIYALSSYYDATKNAEALQLAMDQFHIVEKKCTDKWGYVDAFLRNWTTADNEKLSEDGFDAKKTMNTLLHLIEAYTELYRVSKNAEVADALRKALHLCMDKLYDPEQKILKVFFDEEMNTIADLHSYGHDIEAAWLLDRACKVLQDECITKMMTEITSNLTNTVLEKAFVDGVLFNQRLNDTIDKTRIWWVEAEAIVGSLNEYEKTQDKKYLETAVTLWETIKKLIIDPREGAEWYSDVFENDEPNTEKSIADEWKCPYHNGRMCMEVINRYDGRKEGL